MCGIAGIHRRTKGPVRRHARLASELLRAIEHRGRDATGLLGITDGGDVRIHKDTMTASKFVKDAARFAGALVGNPRSVLLHTRFATVGAVNKRNAHPVVNGRACAIHNGTIYNHEAVFARIRRKRNAAVDSEVIPAVVDHYGWDKAAKALSHLRGGAATAIVSADHPGEVILARLDHYPLHVYVSPSLVLWASTREAIERAWHRTYGSDISECGEWIEVPPMTLMRINGEITQEKIPNPPRPKVTTGARPMSNRQWKKQQRRKQRNQKIAQLAMTLPEVSDVEPLESYVEDEIRTLMRIANLNREEAEEVVLGCSRGDVVTLDDWDDFGGWGLDGLSSRVLD